MAVIRRRKLPVVRRRSDTTIQSDPAVAIEKLFGDLTPDQRVWFGQGLLGLVLLAGSSPVELAVPLVRFLGGQRGIQTGAALGSLLWFMAGRAYSGAMLRQLIAESATSADPEHKSWHERYDRLITRLLFSGAVWLPSAGAVLPTVVLRKRSPLWGLALWLLVRLCAVTVLAMDASRLKKPREAQAAVASE